MPSKERNKIQIGEWVLSNLYTKDDFLSLGSFDCGDDDLNDFFRNDALDHKEELLAEIYSFSHIEACSDPVAFVSFSNDSIELTQRKRKKLFNSKIAKYRFLPAVKMGRLGVLKSIQGKDIGTNLLNMIKKLFVTENRTGCRFLTVDAYNRPITLKFYEKNEFQFLHKKDEKKNTRIMYFDLKRYKK